MRVRGRAGLASWPGSLPDRAGGARGHRGAERSRSDAAGALDAGSGEPMMGAARGMGIPGVTCALGGGRGFGQGWRTGTAWRLPPSLPLSYTRVGTAGLYPAGWCPSLRTRVAGAFTDLTGIVPATASVPVRHRLGGVMWLVRGSCRVGGHLGPGEPGELAGDRGDRLARRFPAADQVPVPGVQPPLRLPGPGQGTGAAPAWRRRKVAPIAGPCW